VTQDSAAPELPFYLWAQWWARLVTLFGLAACVFAEVQFLVKPTVLTVPLVLVFLFPLWVFARATFLHVHAAAEGVRVFNPLHTYNVRWDEIEVVEAVDQVSGIGGYARIVKTDGDAVTLAVSNFGIRGDPTSALRIAVPLGKALDRQRARSMAAP
jgi:hypothetical protein